MPRPPPHSVADFQAKLNRSTRRQWDWYTAHRREIESLLLPLGTAPGPRLAVLGAGNCNDLSLPTLADYFDEIHLVDIDSQTLRQAIARQNMHDSRKIHLHDGIDLTGLAELLTRPLGRSELVRLCRERLAMGPSWSPEQLFDVVVSPCVLSQLIRSVASVIGDDHADFAELAVALRRQHLQQVARLLSPGGWGALAIDLVSNNTLAALNERDTDLRHLMKIALNTGNFFSGLSPQAFLRDLQSAQACGTSVASIREAAPWRWRLGEHRSYLVYGLSFQVGHVPKSGSSASHLWMTNVVENR